MQTATQPFPSPPSAQHETWRVGPVALVLLAGLAAWWGVWHGQFVFDDFAAIAENDALCAGDWWHAAFAERHHPLVNRPLACLTIALDFAIHGPGPFGPHLTNLLLHLTNGVLVLTTVRGALQAPNLAGRFDPARASRLATAVALLWIVHPLCGDAVAYATQRSTLLFSGCLLLAMTATLRAARSARPAVWRAIGVAAVACGMASKEDMVVAPLLLLLWERAFLVPTWAALRSRAGYLALLACSWSVLAVSLVLGPSNPTVGYATSPPATAWQWLMTQAGVLVHYLRLVVFPSPLRGAYDWGVVQEVGRAVLPGLVVIGLLLLTVRSWSKQPWWGFLGALFFLQLAPTSSVMPIVTEILAERRMYLPMFALLVPVVVLLERALRGRGMLPLAVVAIAAAGLLVLSRERVAVHATPSTFWADAYAKRDPGSRSFLAGQILGNHGNQAFEEGRIDEATQCFEAAMACEHTTMFEQAGFARILQHQGKHTEAVALLRRLAEQHPTVGDIQGRFGIALVGHWNAAKGRPDDPRLVEATTVLQRAVELSPRHAGFWHTLGYVHRVRGDLPAAAEAFRRSAENTTTRIDPYVSLAEVLMGLGRDQEVGAVFAPLLQANPDDVGMRLQLGEILRKHRRDDLARPLLDEVLQLDATNERARTMLKDMPTRPR